MQIRISESQIKLADVVEQLSGEDNLETLSGAATFLNALANPVSQCYLTHKEIWKNKRTMHLALFNSLLEAVFLRLALCWIFESVLNYGFAGVCLGMALSTLPPAMIGLAYLHWGRWRKGGSKD